MTVTLIYTILVSMVRQFDTEIFRLIFRHTRLAFMISIAKFMI